MAWRRRAEVGGLGYVKVREGPVPPVHGPGPPPFHVRGSHRSLVPTPEELALPGDAPVDPRHVTGLVAVPAARPAHRTAVAARLAAELGWPLLVLCSREARAVEVRDVAGAVLPAGRLTALHVGVGQWLRGPRNWRVVAHPAALQRHQVDTNRKRNVALAAARMTGADHLLFVDDDVTGLRADDVAVALGLLAVAGGATSRDVGPRVVGWPVEDFPDNSVVHHARREFLGLHQDSFLSGGALLVRLDGWTPPVFPPVYNEDWLFLFEVLARRRLLAGRPVGQERYDPFDSPARARGQEFGDVLGEGLFHLLHAPRQRRPDGAVDVEQLVLPAMQADYWRPVRAHRLWLLEDVTHRVRGRRFGGGRPPLDPARLDSVLHAMAEARSQLLRATPELLADFVVRWRDDLVTWNAFLDGLPRCASLRDALRYLGHHDAAILQG